MSPHVFSFPETQDDLEAITNDIKKMANNARNKLKSESTYQYLSLSARRMFKGLMGNVTEELNNDVILS